MKNIKELLSSIGDKFKTPSTYADKIPGKKRIREQGKG